MKFKRIENLPNYEEWLSDLLSETEAEATERKEAFDNLMDLLDAYIADGTAKVVRFNDFGKFE